MSERSTITKLRASKGAFASVAGELVFARHARHLVLIDEPTGEPVAARCDFSATIQVVDGTLVVESLTLGRDASHAHDRKPPWTHVVTAEILRAARVEGILNLTRQHIRATDADFAKLAAQDHLKDFLTGWAPRAQEAVRENVGQLDELEQRPRPPRGGRRPLGDDHYRTIAVRCLELFESGRGPGVHRTIAREYGRKPRTVADWIRTARKLGYLAEGNPGVVTFTRGQRLLAEQAAPVNDVPTKEEEHHG